MVRFIVSIFAGAAVAFTLFVVMAKLIENTNRPADEVPETPVIDIVMSEPDEDTQTRNRVPPPPPPPPQQPPKMQPTEPEPAELQPESDPEPELDPEPESELEPESRASEPEPAKG